MPINSVHSLEASEGGFGQWWGRVYYSAHSLEASEGGFGQWWGRVYYSAHSLEASEGGGDGGGGWILLFVPEGLSIKVSLRDGYG